MNVCMCTYVTNSPNFFIYSNAQLQAQLEKGSPDVDELQKRIKVLQGRLEREKSRPTDEMSRYQHQKLVIKPVEPQVENKVSMIIPYIIL